MPDASWIVVRPCPPDDLARYWETFATAFAHELDEEARPGGIACADAPFRTDVAPWCADGSSRPGAPTASDGLVRCLRPADLLVRGAARSRVGRAAMPRILRPDDRTRRWE